MKIYKVFVLMSFNSQYDFVYESIRNAVETYHKVHNIQIEVKRADDYVETKKNKVQEIMDQMREADFLILDFSERTENVMWEFGFAQCLSKHIIALDCSRKPNPFNIAETDKIAYTFSPKGLMELEAKLHEAFLRTIKSINKDTHVLLEDSEVKALWAKTERCLKAVPLGSITHKLVTNELERISRRVTGIENSSFELRNVKPPGEVAEYYCDYLSQLEGEESSFSVVTRCDFWVTISLPNQNRNYLMANKRALDRGATISRVFILPRTEYIKTNKSFGNLMRDVLKEHLGWTEKFPSQITAKVITDDGAKKKLDYKNLGILKKSNELLLFQPEYDASGKMEKTIFFYDKTGNQKREIRTAQDIFSNAFEQATPIQELQSHWLFDN